MLRLPPAEHAALRCARCLQVVPESTPGATLIRQVRVYCGTAATCPTSNKRGSTPSGPSAPPARSSAPAAPSAPRPLPDWLQKRRQGPAGR